MIGEGGGVISAPPLSSDMSDKIQKQILRGAAEGEKSYAYAEGHDPHLPADLWFQQDEEGLVLFVVFFSQACRWSRCLGCNLPSKMSTGHVDYRALIRQIDAVFERPDVAARREKIAKLIVSNNGSILDEATFSSTALMYLLARVNLQLPNLTTLNLETRPEYVDLAELEFLSRALAEGQTPTRLELAVGFEAFDERIRNEVFHKGLELAVFEDFVARIAPYRYRLKCYFMQKPVPGMSDAAAIEDIRQAIGYLGSIARRFDLTINLHLNPTYVARGTALEEAFRQGDFTPPRLRDVAEAAWAARDEPVSVFVGLFDEGLAVPGGSFLRPGEESLVAQLERFNRTQDFSLLPGLFKDRIS